MIPGYAHDGKVVTLPFFRHQYRRKPCFFNFHDEKTVILPLFVMTNFIFPYKKAPYDLGACLHYHLSLLFPAAISPPPEIINQSNDSRRKADAEIHEGVAQDVHRKAQDGSCKAYGNILGPEIGGRGDACPGVRGALDRQGLKAGRKSAEADAEKG